jgi:hypothetical protein
VVRSVRRAKRDRVLTVVPANARYAGVIACWCGAVMRAAPQRRKPAAQPAVPADRFAREIVRILTAFAVRSRQLMGNPLGRPWPVLLLNVFLLRFLTCRNVVL